MVRKGLDLSGLMLGMYCNKLVNPDPGLRGYAHPSALAAASISSRPSLCAA